MEKIVIAAFAGSLRQDSFNKAIINTAKKYAPENIEINVLDLNGIPLYNQDEEGSMPESVRNFKNALTGRTQY
jgi:Predicted flavoprotein